MKKVLIIDDNELNLKILGLILTKVKYKVDKIVNPKYAIDEILANPPDIILLDISMPEIDGFKLCSLIKHNEQIRKIPIIFVTMHSNPDFIVRGFEYGAVDYITKPFNAEEVKARVATHLKVQELQNKLFEINKNLEQLVHEKIIKITDTYMETIYSLAKLAQSKNGDTDKDLQRIRRYCYILSKELQKNHKYRETIDEKFLKDIFNAATLYNSGKAATEDNDHTIIGYNTLNEILKKFPENKFIKMGMEISRSHHEKWNGSGFPDGLK